MEPLLTQEERDAIIARLREEQTPVPDPIRDAAIAAAADDPEAVETLWNCLMEFQAVAKAINSPHAAAALKAAGYINRLRAAVELPKTPKEEKKNG